MSVIIDELEIVPGQAAPPPGEPTPRTAPGMPSASVEEQAERAMQVLEARVARLRAD